VASGKENVFISRKKQKADPNPDPKDDNPNDADYCDDDVFKMTAVVRQ